MDFKITRIRNFDDYVSKVFGMFDYYRKFQKEDLDKYEDLKMTFSNLLESDKPEREEDVLNFLIETNVAEFDTYDYAVLKINQDLCEKSYSEKYEILKTFQNRLHKLKYKPSYQHLYISSLDTLVFASLYKLNKYVDTELTKYDSSMLDNKIPSINSEKIKTMLSVKQLSLLFRMLSDDKVIECDNVTKLSKQISSTFSSKKADDISDKSVKNHFDSPDNEAIKFWKTELGRLKQLLENY